MLSPATPQPAGSPGGSPQGSRFRPTLRVYGDHLLTSQAAFWIACASVLIVIMASAEAVAWGYVASFMAQGGPRWVVALLVGLAVFSIIWILDATLMTLDLRRSRDDTTLLGRKGNEASRRLERWRFLGGLSARLLLVLGSLYLSAPFLAQLVFYDDIEARIASENLGAVAAVRARLEADHLAQREALEQERRGLFEASVAEAAGRGPSQRSGRGPAVETLERQIAQVDQSLEASQTRFTQELSAFDALNPEQVAERYGVALAGGGLEARGAILDQLLEGEEYDHAEWSLRAFLFFLFVALLILKLFQPRSVEVYFSERLQSLYRQYLGGVFDSQLAAAERPSGSAPMDPLRFEDWCLSSYALHRQEEQERRESARKLVRLEQRVEQLQSVAHKAQSELRAPREAARMARETLLGLEEQRSGVREELAGVAQSLEERVRVLSAVEQTLRSQELDPVAFEGAAQTRAQVRQRVAALTERRGALERRLFALDEQHAQCAARLSSAQREWSSRRGIVETVDEEIARVRDHFLTPGAPGSSESRP